MEKITITKDELNNLSKDMIVMLYLQLHESFQLISEQNTTIQKQNEQMLHQVESMKEQISILTQNRFGRKSEKTLPTEGQLSFDFENLCIFNEAESLTENGISEELDMETVLVRKRKPRSKGKRDINLKDIDTIVVSHERTEKELSEHFPKGWHNLPDEIYKELKYVPAHFEVLEHHIKVYAGNHDTGGILRAEVPLRLLSHSILTPELAGAIINAKYVNAVPLNRLSEEFLRNDVNIPRQDMAGWLIRIYQYYLGPVRDMMKAEIMKSHHIHCDETPFVMPEKSKQYMWVYHSPGSSEKPPVFLYEYPGTRGTAAPREFLKGYKGTLVTDGYQVYHTLAKERSDDLKVAGCWSHARRRFAEIVKASGKNGPSTFGQKIAAEAVKRIAAIYHVDHMYEKSFDEERLDHRKNSVKPLVDAYFEWVKEYAGKTGLDKSSKLAGALNYSIHQEQFLRVFLEDPEIPLDNNDAERSVRSFCVGKHSWHIIDSKNGAEASAALYSIAETAKANNLKPYEYFSYLLEQLMHYPRNNVPENKLAELMPWSDELPDRCRKLKTR